jgi:hypothetical protein
MVLLASSHADLGEWISLVAFEDEYKLLPQLFNFVDDLIVGIPIALSNYGNPLLAVSPNFI